MLIDISIWKLNQYSSLSNALPNTSIFFRQGLFTKTIAIKPVSAKMSTTLPVAPFTNMV